MWFSNFYFKEIQTILFHDLWILKRTLKPYFLTKCQGWVSIRIHPFRIVGNGWLLKGVCVRFHIFFLISRGVYYETRALDRPMVNNEITGGFIIKQPLIVESFTTHISIDTHWYLDQVLWIWMIQLLKEGCIWIWLKRELILEGEENHI